MDNSTLLLSWLFFIPYLAFIIAAFTGLWKINTKAGKPGWAALVPVYNLVVLHEIVGRNAWKLLLWVIPVVNFYFSATLFFSLARSFGRDSYNGRLLTISFAPFYLGFGSAAYVGPSEGPNAGVPRPVF